MQAIINADIVLTDHIVKGGTVYFEDRIVAIKGKDVPVKADRVIDAKGNWLFPGLIDIHSHGRCGHHVLDGDDGELMKYADALIKCGVTRFLPATMTASLESTQKALDCVRRNMGKGSARVIGANLEGPFLSEEYKGAHESRYLLPPDPQFVEKNADVVKIVTVAPETDQTGDFIPRARKAGAVVSLGHCAATYEETVRAVEEGATSFTHLFNAMNPFHHMRPGTVGAALMLDEAYVEIIGDGEHVKAEIYPLIIKCKPLNKILLITDCQTVGGLAPGTYQSGGMVLKVDERIARLESGVIAGSVISLNNAVRNFYRNTSLTLPQVVRMASLNQAELLQIDRECGSISVGKYADLVIMNRDFEAEMTIVEGQIKFEKGTE